MISPVILLAIKIRVKGDFFKRLICLSSAIPAISHFRDGNREIELVSTPLSSLYVLVYGSIKNKRSHDIGEHLS